MNVPPVDCSMNQTKLTELESQRRIQLLEASLKDQVIQIECNSSKLQEAWREAEGWKMKLSEVPAELEKRECQYQWVGFPRNLIYLCLPNLLIHTIHHLKHHRCFCKFYFMLRSVTLPQTVEEHIISLCRIFKLCSLVIIRFESFSRNGWPFNRVF